MDERIQRGLSRHFERLRVAHAGGEERLGWKVAFNAEAIQRALHLDGSLIAGLTKRTLVTGTFPLVGTKRVALEAEVAVRLKRNVEPDMSEAEVASCIEAWGPAVELVDFDRPLDELEEILAEGVFHRAVRLGPAVTPNPEGDLSGLVARVEHSGHLVCEVDARRATGHAPAILAHLAKLLAPFAERLAQGDIVILGSMNAPTWAEPGGVFTCTLNGIGSASVTTE